MKPMRQNVAQTGCRLRSCYKREFLRASFFSVAHTEICLCSLVLGLQSHWSTMKLSPNGRWNWNGATVTCCGQEVSMPVEGGALSASSTFPCKPIAVMQRMTSTIYPDYISTISYYITDQNLPVYRGSTGLKVHDVVWIVWFTAHSITEKAWVCLSNALLMSNIL